MSRIRSFCLLICLVFSASSAWAGWVIQYAGGGAMSPSASYIQDNKMRQDMGGMMMIMDVNKGWVYYVNPNHRTYWGGPASEIRSTGQAEARKTMEEMMKNLPPDQREAMQKAMGQVGRKEAEAPKQFNVKVTKTGKSATIAGYKTEEYQILVEGQPFMEVWIAPKIDVSKDIDAKKMTAMMGSLSPQDSGHNPFASPEVQALWQKGYPLRQTLHFMGQATTVEAQKVEKKSLPSSDFSVPSGYRKVGFMEVMR